MKRYKSEAGERFYFSHWWTPTGRLTVLEMLVITLFRKHEMFHYALLGALLSYYMPSRFMWYSQRDFASFFAAVVMSREYRTLAISFRPNYSIFNNYYWRVLLLILQSVMVDFGRMPQLCWRRASAGHDVKAFIMLMILLYRHGNIRNWNAWQLTENSQALICYFRLREYQYILCLYSIQEVPSIWHEHW